jgi:hypothetical protein
MSSPRFESFLARLYSDDEFLNRFLASPDQAMTDFGLDDREKLAAGNIDRVGLMMAARSYRIKRQSRRPSRRSFWRRAFELLAFR